MTINTKPEEVPILILLRTGLVVHGRKADVVEGRAQAGLGVALDLGLGVRAGDNFTLEADRAHHIELQPQTAHNPAYPP